MAKRHNKHPFSPRMEDMRHELFEGIIAHTIRIGEELGFAQDVAEQFGVGIVEHLIKDWRGQYITIPMDYAYRIAHRDYDLYRSHKGDFAETARKFNMTDRGARKAYDRAYRRLVEKNQGTLFDGGDDDNNKKE